MKLLRALPLLIILLPSAPALSDNPKLFTLAKDAFSRNEFAEAASLCWRYLASAKQGAEKLESAQFYLAASLEKLRYYHAAVEYYFQVANTRQTPELLPRAMRALEAISLELPFDEGLILRDLVGDTDFGSLPGDLSDFVYYWQGVTNLDRGLEAWATERFAKVSRRGYYFFAALYVASVRLLAQVANEKPEKKAESAKAFAQLFGSLDLVSALDSLRRRGEADGKLAYSLRALLSDEGAINVKADKLPKGWEVELAMLGLARVAAESGALLSRAGETDDEQLGLPLSYAVNIGGMPIYTRAVPFEERPSAIRAVATRVKGVRAMRGKALHSLARLLYEQKQYASTYDTLGTIPKGTELGSEILLERAWAKYRAGDPHRAMGLLYALDAPVYHDLFSPEKYLLRGLIYRRFCHFRAAKLAARRFRTEFGATLLKIRDGVVLEEIPRLREAALRRVHSRKLHLFVRSLRQELASIQDRDNWNRGLVKQLKRLYQKKLEQMKTELGRALGASLREVAEEMLDTEEQVNLLEYEVGQAIFQRVSDQGALSAVRKRAARIPLSSERVYYRFSGEYWTDELPHYKFNIEDRCVD